MCEDCRQLVHRDYCTRTEPRMHFVCLFRDVAKEAAEAADVGGAWTIVTRRKRRCRASRPLLRGESVVFCIPEPTVAPRVEAPFAVTPDDGSEVL